MSVDETPGREAAVLLYTRPGCAFCGSLRRGLRRRGVPFSEVDIWQHPESAAVVRAAAGGHETVPTVVVGEEVLVNPKLDRVLAAFTEHLPELARSIVPTPSLAAKVKAALRARRD